MGLIVALVFSWILVFSNADIPHPLPVTKSGLHDKNKTELGDHREWRSNLAWGVCLIKDQRLRIEIFCMHEARSGVHAPILKVVRYPTADNERALGNTSRHLFPTSTFAGLRPADLQFNIKPTPKPWTPSNISKRFADDPAICGWVEGNDNDAVSCQSGHTCAATSTFVGCCSKSNSKDRSCTDFFTTCYDVRGKSCDAACSSNTAALICDDLDQPYCATYRYASGSRGYGCAKSTNFDKTVLTVTSSSVTQPTPFGHDLPTTSIVSTSSAGEASSTSNTGLATSNSATAVPVKPKSMSGGATAGTVVGSVVGAAAILLILLILFQKYRKKQAQRQGNQTSQGPYELEYQHIYDQYGKPVYSPPWSPQSHSRHQSDGQSELAGVPVSPDPSHKNSLVSPNISEADGRPFSPETVQSSLLANHEFSDGGQQNQPAELPGVDR